MKKITLPTLLLTLIIGIKQAQAQFYNQGSEVTIQAGATVTVEGDFVNKATSNFKNSGTLVIKQYVTNDQLMTADFGGYWIFNGTSTQKIGGVEPIWIYALNINNSVGFLLQNSLRINKQMEFNNGVMTAENPGNVVFFTPSGAIGSSAPTDASHINGEVVKEGTGQVFTYPVGDGTKYQPIEVNFTTNDNGLLGKYMPIDAGSAGFGTSGSESTPLNSYNSKEHWDLTPINGGTVKASVKLFWDGYNDSFIEAVGLRRVAHLSSITSKWENEGTNAGVGTTALGSVTSNSIGDWSPFTLGTVAAVPLPIRLLSFTGKNIGNYNQLNWATSLEANASHFEIERTVDAKKFENIGKVYLNEAGKYSFLDRTPTWGHTAFYRLKLIDIDGKFAYSKIISIAKLAENQLVGQFYPNPAMGNLAYIEINSLQKASWVITQFDQTGKVFARETKVLEKGLNILQINGLVAGLNLFKFESNDHLEIRKLFK